MKPAKMGVPRKWTQAKCKKSAQNYSNVTEWKFADAAAYIAAKRYDWLEEVTKHFTPLGNQYRRLVYVCRVRGTLFVYVGLTLNFKKRKLTHLNSDRFINLAKEYGERSIKFFKMTGLIPSDTAALIEKELIRKYETRNFCLLNKKIGGGLGASAQKWTYEAVEEDASNYDYVGEWSLKSHAAYTAALEKNWIDQLVEDEVISRKINKKGFLTKNKIIETAKSSKSRKEWRTNHSWAYVKAAELGLHYDPEVVSHFESSYKYKGQDDRIKYEVEKYSTLKEFREGSSALYTHLKKTGRLSDFISTLVRRRRSSPWTKKEIMQEASRHSNKTKFQQLGKGAYTAAKRLGCFEEATKHMIRPKKS